jgi:ubiquinone/menaquinone biosynthesis C-methylase UbiE
MADDMGLPQVFFEIHAGLPRQGVGSDEATRMALELCAELPASPDVLDVGCGPGAQTLALARATGGRITAADLHAPFLDELLERARAADLGEQIALVEADMRALPFEPGSFDLVWSEGAAYIMGISEALAAWRPLLRAGGYLGFSEIVWTGDERPAAVADLVVGYPGMTDVAGNLERIGAAGYEVVGHFRLPESAWWDEYYGPLEARLPEFERRYAEDEDGLAVVAATRREIAARRAHQDTYAYEFFVAWVRPGPT